MSFLIALLIPLVLFFLLNRQGGGQRLQDMFRGFQMPGNNRKDTVGGGTEPLSSDNLKQQISTILTTHRQQLFLITVVTSVLILLLQKKHILTTIPYAQEWLTRLPTGVSDGFLGGIIVSASILLGTLWLVRQGKGTDDTIIIAESVNGTPTRLTDIQQDIKKLISPTYQRASIAAIIGLLFGFSGLFGSILLTTIIFSLTTKNQSGRRTTIIARRQRLFAAVQKISPYRRARALGGWFVWSSIDSRVLTTSMAQTVDQTIRLISICGRTLLRVFCLYAIVFVHWKLVMKK